MNVILEMKGIVKTYNMGEEEQVVLDNVDLEVYKGEFISVLGPSGSGKSTLMNIIGCLDVPTSGKYILNENEVDTLDEIELAEVRNNEIGFVFQQFQLLPRLTALQNVELPLIYSGIPEKERKRLAIEMLEKVGLGGKLKNRPNQLSGGQQQRVAIARALVTQPTILLADEPTGALDQKTGIQIMNLFAELHKEGKTIIMITHDEKIAKHGSRIVRILDGKLTEVGEDSDKTTNNNEDITEAIVIVDNKQQVSVTNPKTLSEANTIKPHNEAFNQMLSAIATLMQDEKVFNAAGDLIRQFGESFKKDQKNLSTTDSACSSENLATKEIEGVVDNV